MTLASFEVKDKLSRSQFFQKLFLLTDSSSKIVLKMLFWFLQCKYIICKTWTYLKTFITSKALPTTKQVEFIEKKIIKKTLNKNIEVFVMYIISLASNLIHQD